MDWGKDFLVWHSDQFPRYAAPSMHFSLGAIALRHILAYGGAGYFPAQVVASDIAAGKLFQVHAAPQFLRPSHLVFSTSSLSEVTKAALDSLRATAAVDAAA